MLEMREPNRYKSDFFVIEIQYNFKVGKTDYYFDAIL